MILILILAFRVKSGHSWFWYKKTPVYEPTNNEMLLKALRNIITELVSTIKLTITMHFIEMIVIVALVIAIVFLLRWLYKGRPSCDEHNTKSQDKETSNNAPNMSTMYQPNTATTVNLYGSVQLKDPIESTHIWNNGNKFSPINNIVKAPKEFNESMCVETWLEQIECFLRPFDKRIWVETASTYLSEAPYKKIRNMKELKKKEDGFDQLKKQLIDSYAAKKNNFGTNLLTFQDVLSRVQLENESVSNFGNNLISIAQIALPNVCLEHIDDILKDQFIFGIRDERIREKVTMKLDKTNDITKQKITLTELINYAQVVDNSFIGRKAHRMLRRNYNSDDSGSDQPKQIEYEPQQQSLSICSVSQKIESAQAKELTTKYSIRNDNPNLAPKSNNTQNKAVVEARSTQTDLINDGPVTAENILQKRAEIREFYVKQRGTDQQQSFNQARPQTNRYQNQQNIRRNQQICQFCGKKGHEMKVCHSYNRQQLNDINQNSQDARMSNQTQHYPQQNQQYDQSYNYSQQRYNAANFQKNVHFEDETNSKQTPTDSRPGTSQQFSQADNSGRPSTPQNSNNFI